MPGQDRSQGRLSITECTHSLILTHSFARSFWLAVLAVASCLLWADLTSGGTVGHRPALPVQPNQLKADTIGSKSPGRRIMHPAFADAGRSPGLEIWRIEVSSISIPFKRISCIANGGTVAVACGRSSEVGGNKRCTSKSTGKYWRQIMIKREVGTLR